jgi:hypothetical protein
MAIHWRGVLLEFPGIVYHEPQTRGRKARRAPKKCGIVHQLAAK